MTEFTATLPNGTRVANRSKTRTYTHVVVAINPETGEQIDWRWSESEANANKGRSDAERRGFATTVIAVN
jgi:hypothetical protein